MFAQKHARAACNIVPTLMFRVLWDGDRRKYVALDTAGTLLGEFDDIAQAIGRAHLRAITASESGVRVVVVVQGADGRMRHDWTAEPPVWTGPRGSQSGR
jgi:hypothetical protein